MLYLGLEDCKGALLFELHTKYSTHCRLVEMLIGDENVDILYRDSRLPLSGLMAQLILDLEMLIFDKINSDDFKAGKGYVVKYKDWYLDLNLRDKSNREIHFLVGFYNSIVDSVSCNKSFAFVLKSEE